MNLAQIALVTFCLFANSLGQNGFVNDEDTLENKQQVFKPYSFEYNVADLVTGDIKNHKEFRNEGSNTVTGEYNVLQPDGCVRNVKYTAGPRGFFPVVTYVGNCDQKSYMAPAADEAVSGRNGPDENDQMPSARIAAAANAYQTAQYYAAAVAQAPPTLYQAPIVQNNRPLAPYRR